MSDPFLAMLDHTIVGAPPRKPPVSRPVKLGGAGNGSQSDPPMRQNGATLPHTPSKDVVSEPRPAFADAIDIMIAAWCNSGDLSIDRATGEYVGVPWRCYRFERT